MLQQERERLPRLVVLISGSGSNLQAILDATANDELAAQVVLVVSNRRHAYGLVRAQQAGVPTHCAPFRAATDDVRVAYDLNLADRIAASRPDLIILAGWMHILSPAFLERFPDQVINLHPALPGQFPGVHAIERAYACYEQNQLTQSGCMVHYVVPEVDAGPLIAQSVVPFEPDDTLEQFEARMHAAEHRLIVSAIATTLEAQLAVDRSMP